LFSNAKIQNSYEIIKLFGNINALDS
jgi:hypothetical protein